MDILKSAVESSDLQTISEILNGDNLDDYLHNSYEILNYVIQHRSKEIVLLLIDKGFSVNKAFGNGSTPLHHAALRGCTDILQALLSKGASLDAKDTQNNTPLMIASEKEDKTMVDIMLPFVKKNHFSNVGLSHMHIACTRNNVKMVKRFLQLGIPMNHAVDFHEPRFGGFTPLHFAANCQSLETVEFLVNCGANVSLKDAKGMTPLHIAYRQKNNSIVNSILSGHIYNSTNPEDPERVSHFHIACTTNNPKIVEAFLKHDENSDRPTILQSCDYRGFTPLHFAIDGGCKEVVRLLLDYNADPTKANKKKMRPTDYAKSRGNTEIASLIQDREEAHNPSVYWILKDSLEIKTDAKKKPEKRVYSKKTPELHVACTQDILSAVITVVAIIQELKREQGDGSIDGAIDPDSPIWPGCTALHLAVEHNNVTIAEELLRHGADVAIKDVRGFTPLHLAFRRGHRAIVDLVLASRGLRDGAPTDATGLSHFHVFCTARDARQVEDYLAGRPEAVELRVGEDSAFCPGYMGLHFAVQYRAADVFRSLLARGASVSARTALGLTALDLAAEGMAASGDRRVHLSYLDFVEAVVGDGGVRGFSRLHIACARNDLGAVRVLADQRSLNERVDPDLAYWAGYTPLHVAVEFRNREVAELLLNNLAKVNVRDARGNTPLHLLLASAYPFFKPEDYRATDKQREFAGWLDMLIDAGADINLQNYAGETLQHLSCKLDYRFSVTEIILKSGADVANLNVMQLPKMNDRNVVVKHMTLLNVLGVNLQNYDDRYKCLSESEREIFRSNCLEELRRMKEIKLNYRFNLYDILSVDADEVSVLATNEELRRIVDAEDFDNHFEIYGFLIKLLFKKVSVRRELMAKTEKSLVALTGLQIPVSCHETIYKYLDNEDLRNVFRAYNLRNEKER